VAAWASYKQHFIQADGRVVDPAAGNITTSEGQSYALLRAVWQDDRQAFDTVLGWTQANLQLSPSGPLFAYKWGQAAGNNSWGVLDAASATDADCDIALALVFASRHCNDLKYWKLALDVLTAVWEREVVMVQGQPYLSAGDWAPAKQKVALNPSYLAPYTMRIFATLDPYHNWLGLVDSAYRVIRGCSETTLAGVQAVKLPANWCGIDRQTSQLSLAQDYPKLDTNYGYDAFRTMWRVALDYQWSGDRRALDYLTWSDTLRVKWRQAGKLAAVYDYGGQPVQPQEDLAVYGGDLANFWLTEPTLAAELVNTKLLPAFKDSGADGNQAGWGDLQNYYTQNWVWFGLALYAGALPDLAAVTPPSPTGPLSTPVTSGPVVINQNPAVSPTPLLSPLAGAVSPTPIVISSPEGSGLTAMPQTLPVTPSPTG
jgi:endoglucanase